ncbi:putative Zinc finger FYVE domain-containing protein [Medicago truncatula]|uniref:Putative Zinc finger FYVE domain-containing protein n=1 Tax=Medicago truncatula TaxID=3880 RepID=A0A396IZZ6_MEDTR|nr:putative Zinc finger FYVE domain-containing protein [Medicago truncatula]
MQTGSITLQCMFHNLTHLKLIFDFMRPLGLLKWNWLIELLENFPKLQTLIIHKADIVSKFTDRHRKEPKFVPECLSSHLTTCSLRNYSRINCEFPFAKYIMQNSGVLRTMTNIKLQMFMELSYGWNEFCISVNIKGISLFTRHPCINYYICNQHYCCTVRISSPLREHHISVSKSQPKQKVRSGATPRLSLTSSLSNFAERGSKRFSWAPKHVYWKRKSSRLSPSDRVAWETMTGIQEDCISPFFSRRERTTPFCFNFRGMAAYK